MPALGAIAGVVSALFIRSIYGCEHIFQKHVKGGYYVQHLAGMLVVGILMYLMMCGFGHYYVEGVGYATIQDVLSGLQHPLYLLILLFFAKLLATSLTLGSGASGGIFSPALFLGATSGAAWGVALNQLIPTLHVSPEVFAIVGMGAVVGGSTGAAMAAIVMIFEMTLDYTVIIPMTLTVAISYAVRRSLISDSIYTRKLTLRGESIPETMRADIPFSRRAADIMQPSTPEDSAGWESVQGNGWSKEYVTVQRDAPLLEIVTKMCASDVPVALVTSENGNADLARVEGTITCKEILDRLASDMKLFAD